MTADLSLETPRPAWWKLGVIGVGAGLMSGVLGIGGGLVLVPTLTSPWIGYPRRSAAVISLVCIPFITAAGGLEYLASGHVDVSVGLCIMAGLTVGVVASAHWVHKISDRIISLLFSAVALASAVWLVVGHGVGGSHLLSGGVVVVTGFVVGGAAGILAGLVGVGGGIVIVPALVLVFGVTQHLAQGTSLIAIAPTSALGGYLQSRKKPVAVRAIAPVALGGLAGALAGATVAGLLPSRVLQLLFALYLLIYSVAVAWRTVRPAKRAAAS